MRATCAACRRWLRVSDAACECAACAAAVQMRAALALAPCLAPILSCNDALLRCDDARHSCRALEVCAGALLESDALLESEALGTVSVTRPCSQPGPAAKG